MYSSLLPVRTGAASFQPEPRHKLLVRMLGGQWDRRRSQGLTWGASPKTARRNIATHYAAGSNHRSLADSYIRQNDTVRSDENIVFNDDLSSCGRFLRTPIEMRDDRSSHSDGAVVADCYIRGMQFIDIHELADPNVATDRYSAEPMEPRTQIASPRDH